MSEEDKTCYNKYCEERAFRNGRSRCEEVAVDVQEPPCKRSAFSRILGDDLEELTTWRSVLEKVNQEVDNYLQTYLADID